MSRLLGLLLTAVGFVSLMAGTGLAWFGMHEGQIHAGRDLTTAASLSNGDIRNWIAFPEQGKRYFLMEGATQRNLLRGPSHVATSADPGTRGNSIIAAHRDTQFRVLRLLKPGGRIMIGDSGRTFHYVVTRVQVIAASDERFYRPTTEAVLTLVTCYPFVYIGPAPKRYIVRAELIDPAT